MRIRVHRSVAFAISALLALLAGGAILAAGEGYLRYPDLHGDRVVFSAEGDLWLAPVTGGEARRLTHHDGNEGFARFSPDGTRIAFSGQYDGNTDVFVVPSEGGEPRRLTWHPGNDQVIGWTLDGAKILFRSSREHPHGSLELYAIPADGGDPEKLPLGWASRLSIDPESGRWAFNRTQRETRTWKRYRGGTHTEIWVGDPDRADFRRVSDFDGMNAFPMWHGGRIYFLSDAGGTVNLWSMSAEGGDRRRHTDLGDWDARFPGMAPDGRVVFMLAGDLALYDPSSDTTRRLAITLPSDRVLTRNRYPDPERTMTWFSLSPEGDRLAVTTRGEIFSVPVEEGVTLPVTRGSGARESWASFSPDGKRLVYVTDEPREEEIRTTDAWGRGDTKVVKPAGASGWHFAPAWSPDGKWIAYADQTHTLYVMPADGSGAPVVVDRSEQNEINTYRFSPDSRWLAYHKSDRTDYNSIWIYDVAGAKTHRITDRFTDDDNPAWDPEGRYLYFVSQRITNPLLGTRDLQNVNIRASGLFLVTLRPDVENPFADLAGRPPKDDEDKDGDQDGDKKDKKDKKGDKSGQDDGDGDKKKDEAPEPIEIAFDGIGDRVVQIPVEAGNYGALHAIQGKLFYLSFPLRGMADADRSGMPGGDLMMFDMKDEEAKSFLSGVAGFSLAAKGEKIAVAKRPGEIYVVGTGGPPGNDLGKSKVSLADAVIELDPLEEWRQIYYEGWRHQRDFYWDEGMGGVDWQATRDRYATLLPRLATRDDLRDLMGELIGELSTSHTYVFGGDYAVDVERVSTGLLGADLVREGRAYRVARIYRGAPADNEPSPLAATGVGVSEGDYLLAVNHRPFDEGRPFLAYLEGRAGKEVLLTVNDRPTTEGARDVVVVPLSGEGDIRYADWVRRNRETVAEKTGGKAGYVHIPDMGTSGLVEFNTWFYPQTDREAMVVDVRWNGGGFVSQMILERFRRKLISFDRSRGGGVTSYPYRTLNGPFVVLTNQFAGSDGDIFPAAVQLEKLAPVIGMRSWGGVVGIRMDKRLVDGGLLSEPEFAWWDPVQGWDLENRGVVPDIVVENLPQQLARGEDAQLDRGIAEVMRLHAEHPPVEPSFGPVRDRSREAYREELGR